MSSSETPKKKKTTRQIVSTVINWVLGILVVFLVVCQVQIIISKSKSENHGVPSLFGYSFMTVLTDSMVNTANPSESLNIGTGVVMKRVDSSSIQTGDVITFYSETLSQLVGSEEVVSHRVMEIAKASDGTYIFYTRGDNLNAQTCPNNSCPETYRDTVYEKDYIGKIVYHSDVLGGFLSTAQQSWFVPVACLVPLLIIAVSSLVDLLKATKEEEREEDRQVLLALNKAGIDFNDERAVYLFSEKQRIKLELKNTLEKQKEDEKKRLRKEMKAKMEEKA
jgi:signal peptidase I